MADFLAHLAKPVGFTEAKLGCFFTTEVERSLPAEELAKVGFVREPALVQRRGFQIARALQLCAGVMDLVVRAEDFRHARGQRRDRIKA